MPVQVDKDSHLTITIQAVDNLRQRATALPGKYKAAHQLGQLQKRSVIPLSSVIKYFFTLIKYFLFRGHEKCVASYKCSVPVTTIVAFINSL